MRSETGALPKLDRFVAAALLPLSFFLLLPLAVYCANLSSVGIAKSSVLMLGGGLTVCAGLLLWVAASLRLVGRWVAMLADAVSLAIITVILFPNRTGEAAGFGTDLAAVGNWIPVVKLGALFVVFTSWGYCREQQMRAVCRWLFLGLCVLAGGAILGLESNADRTRHDAQARSLEPFSMGRKKNIIVLVLDGFTGARMAEILKERPELVPHFVGFEFYPRTVAPAINTPAGNSVLLTGSLDYAIDVDDWQARNELSVGASYLAEAKALGWDVTYISQLDGGAKGVTPISESALAQQPDGGLRVLAGEYCSFLDVAAYRVLPRFCGKVGSGALGRLLLSSSSAVRKQESLTPQQRIPIDAKSAFERIIGGLHVGQSDCRLLYLLSKLSHPPWVFEENGELQPEADWRTSSRFAVRCVVALIERLKELGVFDNTLLILTSDHGCIPLVDPTMGIDLGAAGGMPYDFNSLLMVKRVGHNDPLRVSEMPTWLGDVAATVRDEIGVHAAPEARFETRSLLQPEDRIRRLKMPVFFRPETASYHGPLKEWVRLDVEGGFADFVRATSLDVNQMLAKGGRIVLRAGVDHYSTDLVANGWLAGSGTQYHALIEVNGRTAGVLANQGMVMLSNENGRYAIQLFSSVGDGLRHIRQLGTNAVIFAAGVQVPRSVLEADLDQAQFGGIREEGDVLNFVIFHKDGRRTEPAVTFSKEDCVYETIIGPAVSQ